MPVDGPGPVEAMDAWLCLARFEVLVLVKGEERFGGGELSMACKRSLRCMLF